MHNISFVSLSSTGTDFNTTGLLKFHLRRMKQPSETTLGVLLGVQMANSTLSARGADGQLDTVSSC